MTIKINGGNLAYTLENEKTIGEILGSIEAACRREHETVVGVHVDGKELNSEELDRLFAEPVNADVTIDLATVSGMGVRRYMQDLIEQLHTSTEEFEHIPVYMQTGKDAQVLSLLESFSHSLNELYRAFLLSDITGLQTDMRIEGKSLPDYQKNITALLQDIVTGIEEKDIIQVSDLAEYELAPLVKSLVNGVSLTLC